MNKISNVLMAACVLLLSVSTPLSPSLVKAQDTLTNIAEQAWGEAGSVAYQAAAEVMLKRNGSSQKLNDFQKSILRPRYGSLVDSVNIIYSATMMEKWCSLGKCITLGGVESAAQTYCNRIYVGDKYKPGDIEQVMLLAHELRHSQQCRERGGEGKFGFHYFREFKRANLSYKNNDMEEDARKAADEVSDRHFGRIPRGYFDNGSTVFFSNGTSYCGFVTPGHLRFYQRVVKAPALPRQSPVGKDTGVCALPSGYFDDGHAVYFTPGDGTVCAFPNPQALDSHGKARPTLPRYGKIDIDPKKFMTYTDVCR